MTTVSSPLSRLHRVHPSVIQVQVMRLEDCLDYVGTKN